MEVDESLCGKEEASTTVTALKEEMKVDDNAPDDKEGISNDENKPAEPECAEKPSSDLGNQLASENECRVVMEQTPVESENNNNAEAGSPETVEADKQQDTANLAEPELDSNLNGDIEPSDATGNASDIKEEPIKKPPLPERRSVRLRIKKPKAAHELIGSKRKRSKVVVKVFTPAKKPNTGKSKSKDEDEVEDDNEQDEKETTDSPVDDDASSPDQQEEPCINNEEEETPKEKLSEPKPEEEATNTEDKQEATSSEVCVDNDEPKKITRSESVTISEPEIAVEAVTDLIADGDSSENRPKRRRMSHDEEALERCLTYIWKTIQKKDPNGYFDYPITDIIAPGYSDIIDHPMDMLKIKHKIQNREYRTVSDLQADFILMCNNALAYNEPDSVFFEAAHKLRNVGAKIFSKERLLSMRKNLDFMKNIPDYELGVTKPAPSGHRASAADRCQGNSLSGQRTDSPARDKGEPEEEEDVEALAAQAAERAAELLEQRCPGSKIGHLKKDPKSGQFIYCILNPDDDGVVSNTERIVKLGELNPRPQSGLSGLPGYREHPLDVAKPVSYLNYGPFSSHAPMYDSLTANISKEDSDLLLSAYGTDLGLQYAESVCRFVGTENDYIVQMADGLLDVLSNGEHTRLCKPIWEEAHKERKRLLQEHEVSKQSSSEEPEKEDVDFSALKSLKEDIGIDMSFLDFFEKSSSIQASLDKTSESLAKLDSSQRERLAKPTPDGHLALVPGPDDIERENASEVVENLKDSIKQALPSDIVDGQTIHAVLTAETESSEEISNNLSPSGRLRKPICFMRWNSKELAQVATVEPFKKEGVLLVKEKQEKLFGKRVEAYFERWLRLKNNLLFVYKSPAPPNPNSEPQGVMIIESVRITYYADDSTQFGLLITPEPQVSGDSPLYLAAKTDAERMSWVCALSSSNYSEIRQQTDHLRDELMLKTGLDPLTTDRASLSNASETNSESAGINSCVKDLSVSAESHRIEMQIVCSDLPLCRDGGPPRPCVTLHSTRPPELNWYFCGSTEIAPPGRTAEFHKPLCVSVPTGFEETGVFLKMEVRHLPAGSQALNLIGGTVFTLEQLMNAANEGEVFSVQITLYVPVLHDKRPYSYLKTIFERFGDEFRSADNTHHSGALRIVAYQSDEGNVNNNNDNETYSRVTTDNCEGSNHVSSTSTAPRRPKVGSADRRLVLRPYFTNIQEAKFELTRSDGQKLTVYQIMGEPVTWKSVPIQMLSLHTHEDELCLRLINNVEDNISTSCRPVLPFVKSLLTKRISQYKDTISNLETYNDTSFKRSVQKFDTLLAHCPNNLRIQRLYVQSESDSETACILAGVLIKTLCRRKMGPPLPTCSPLYAVMFFQRKGHLDCRQHHGSNRIHDITAVGAFAANALKTKKSMGLHKLSNLVAPGNVISLIDKLTCCLTELVSLVESVTKSTETITERLNVEHSLGETIIAEHRYLVNKCQDFVALCQDGLLSDCVCSLSTIPDSTDSDKATSSSNKEANASSSQVLSSNLTVLTPDAWDTKLLDLQLILKEMTNHIEFQNQETSCLSTETVEEMTNRLSSLRTLFDSLFQTACLSICNMLLQEYESVDKELYDLFIDRRNICHNQAIAALIAALPTHFLLTLSRNPSSLEYMSAIGILVSLESLLSDYSDEQPMLEDHYMASQFLAKVTVKLRLCDEDQIPFISGTSSQPTIEIPLPDWAFSRLPSNLQKGRQMRVFPVLFTIGINEKASLADTLGEAKFQPAINERSGEKLQKYFSMYSELPCKDSELTAKLGPLMSRLVTCVCESKSKNVAILHTAQEIARCFNGVRFTSCKSAKDRTAMGISLEQVTLLRDLYSLPQRHFSKALNVLRTTGLFREVSRLNTGVAKYAFNSLQLRYMPKLYQPPVSTCGKVES